jgi:hypothetical protein
MYKAICIVIAVLCIVAIGNARDGATGVVPAAYRAYRANLADSAKAADGTYKPVSEIVPDTSALSSKADSVKAEDGSYKPARYVKPDTAKLANKADSVKSADGSYKPINQIVTGRTDTSSRADSVRWGGSAYKLLDDFLPDSLALFRRKASVVDTFGYVVADSATTDKMNVDSLLVCDSISTLKITADTAKIKVLYSSGTMTAGKVAWTTQRQATYIAGLNSNCIAQISCDSLAVAAGEGHKIAVWCKTDSLVFMSYQEFTEAGNIYYHIIWFAP